MTNLRYQIVFITSGQQPACPPDPAFPHGRDIDMAKGAKDACVFALPYPAESAGAYVVTCPVCGFKGGVTVAGRVDDPKSVRFPCQRPKTVH